MKVLSKFITIIQKFIPSPFALAVLLTYITFILALVLTPGKGHSSHFIEITGYWYKGFWELLTFTMQMILILVLGYVLALTKPVSSFIEKVSVQIKSNESAVFWITLLTILTGYINWGLALIFGATLSRKLAESFSKRNLKFNYPLMGAAGYTGLLVWHGGFSGSAPLKVAEKGHFLENSIGVIPLNETVLSIMNISVFVAFLVLLPVVMFYIAKKTPVKPEKIKGDSAIEDNDSDNSGEKFDNSRIFSLSLTALFFTAVIVVIKKSKGFDFLNLNFINFLLFTSGLLFSENIKEFAGFVSKSIKAASGILIQFPLYAGIMGIMKYSGLFNVFTDAFINISNHTTLPLFTFFSAGLVNFFVPSGGGQWVVQGPVVVEAAKHIGVPVSKVIMALAYGDEWTNMLQPFWALPLLGITGLKAKDIVPYTFIMFLVAGIIFTLSLLIF